MQKYALNIDKSKEVAEHCRKHLKLKMCYNNVFNVVTTYIDNFHNGKWKIAYGYISSVANLLCRHCFIIDENNDVIDPTIALRNDVDAEYYTMKIFDDIDEYFNAVSQGQYYPALERYLYENDKQAQKWADENGFILIG
jgi:hypothetical protein